VEAGTARTTGPIETVAGDWRPRTEAWLARSPSEYAERAVRPLIIGGCPRSGTTLLRGLLNNHPDLAVPAETGFVLPLWTRRHALGDLRREDNKRRLAEWVFDTDGRGGRRIRAGVFTREQAFERVLAAPPTLGSVVAELFQMYADAKGKPRWGDKRPAYATHLKAMFELLPDMQFINVVRDPRATAASLAGTLYAEVGEPFANGVSAWETSVARLDRVAARLRPDQLLDVRYEDLVRDPEGQLKRICDWTGLRGGDAVATMIDGERRGVHRDDWHPYVAQPISTAPIASFRERLDPADIALAEWATSASMERFGYLRDPAVAGIRDAGREAVLARQRKQRGRKWRRFDLAEFTRRLRNRHPVAAR
jgi:Sulfotransferase family